VAEIKREWGESPQQFPLLCFPPAREEQDSDIINKKSHWLESWEGDDVWDESEDLPLLQSIIRSAGNGRCEHIGNSLIIRVCDFGHKAKSTACNWMRILQ
jgi:hypothetical protein